MTTVYLNGEFIPLSEAKISVLDRGFLFADGVYEVIPVYERRPFLLTEHLVRLEYSLMRIQLENPMSREEWQEKLEKMIVLQDFPNQLLYLQITRGAATERNHSFPSKILPTVFIMSSILKVPQPLAGAAITCPDTRWLNCDIKSIGLLGNVLARQAATEQGMMDAIFIRDGYVTETSAANLFLVRNGKIYTAPKNHLILGGITRDMVLRVLREADIVCEEIMIPAQWLSEAEEVWISSSSREISAIVEIDGKIVGNGKIGSIYEKTWELIQAYKHRIHNQPS